MTNKTAALTHIRDSDVAFLMRMVARLAAVCNAYQEKHGKQESTTKTLQKRRSLGLNDSTEQLAFIYDHFFASEREYPIRFLAIFYSIGVSTIKDIMDKLSI